ncbi:unnamed protein product [Closterium sp. NIES-54]
MTPTPMVSAKIATCPRHQRARLPAVTSPPSPRQSGKHRLMKGCLTWSTQHSRDHTARSGAKRWMQKLRHLSPGCSSIERQSRGGGISEKWVFRVKTAADGTIERFKARWVERGYDQRHGIDFGQTFAPVSHHTSVRILLAIVAARHLPLRQIDVKNAFLYALLDLVIYVEQPHTYGKGDSRVCQQRRSLYGIKQAPRLCEYILLTVYVDDLLYTGSSNKLLEQFEKNLAGRVDITCNHDVKQFLRLNISYSSEAIHLSAAKYAEELSKRFNIAPAPLSTPYRPPRPNHKPDNKALSPTGLHTYQQQLGCLLFASVTCRPNLSYIASQLAQYSRKPTAENLLDLQRALQFFIFTSNVGLCYSTIRTLSFNLIGYMDADHAADPNNRRSRTGFLFRLEPSGPISWNSQKQEQGCPVIGGS